MLAVATVATLAITAIACVVACSKDHDSVPAPTPSSSGALVLDMPPSAPTGAGRPPPPPSPSAVSPVTELVVGTGREATAGRTVKVHYDAFFPNGKKFETSRDRRPKSFVLGAGQVIRGWDSGIEGMKVGGRRRLVIPPELAYGSKGSLPTIPPNAVLVFEIELLDVR
jgi:hypothetical protein